ncbi:MAG: hypothetical protein AAGG09_09270 [Pseudomonadota bacterium]
MIDLSEITPAILDDTNAPGAAIGDDLYTSIAELVAAVPALTEPDAAADLAQMVTHFARGRAYRVITDPQAFEAAYRSRIASEDADEPWQQGVLRLVDFGMPDFAEVSRARLEGTSLSWTAEDAFTGLAYRGHASLDDLSAVQFTALALTPVPRGPDREEIGQPDDEAFDAITAQPEPEGIPVEDDMPAEPVEPDLPDLPPVPTR